RIPKARAHVLFPGDWQDTALHLCVCNLWQEDGDSYLVHDFLEYNFSRKRILNSRLHDRQRLKRRRNAASNAKKTEQPVFSSPDVLPGISVPSEASSTVGKGKHGASRRAPRVSWPDDFTLTDERRQVAATCDLDPAWEWNKF